MEKQVEEVKFLALPKVRDLMHCGASEQDLQRYKEAQYRIVHAQHAAALVAVKVIRPKEYKEAQQIYHQACAQARFERNTRMLAVFSETCTKGL